MGRNRKPRAEGNGSAQNITSRADGYVNMLNKYGTPQDNSTAYRFNSGGIVPDAILTEHYEGNGLFSKIIDAPAEEAIKHGFELATDQPDAEELLNDALDALDWGEKAATAIKWARLYGGAIIVMLIDDGGGLDEPLKRESIRGIDDMRVYERAIVQPDWTAALYGTPQTYNVSSISGYFTVHASRCLVFKNGVVPEHTTNIQYRFWGLPEYLRIKNELRECLTSHGLAVKLLDRSVQAIYTMKGLATLLSSEDGEDVVLRRLQLIDKARGILNSIAIDADGENYDFKSVTFAGVKDIIETTCNMLSAVTNIPQTILFGRSPAGMNATGQGDLENYYNLCERIQRMMLYGNLKTLAGVIFAAAYTKGELPEKQAAKIKFKPLWSLSETEQATVEQTRAAASQTKAQTAQVYVDMGALDPSEVRKGLAANKEFDIEKMLDDVPDEDLMAEWKNEATLNEQKQQPPQNVLMPDTYDDKIKIVTNIDDDKVRDENGRFAEVPGNENSPSKSKKGNKGNKGKFPGKGATGKEVATFLEQQGFKRVGKNGGSHQKYKHPDGRQTEVPVHGSKGLPTGTLKSIQRQAGF